MNTKMNKLISIVFLSFSLSNAALQIPIYGDQLGENDIRMDILTKIGDPPQDIQIKLDYRLKLPDLYIRDGNHYPYGFYSDYSKSFVKTGDSYGYDGKKNGINGTDDIFFLYINETVKQKPIRVLSSFPYVIFEAVLGLKRHQIINGTSDCPDGKAECTTFVQAMLREQNEEQVVTLIFGEIVLAHESGFNAAIVFGGKAEEKYCEATKWARMPELPPASFGDQWGFKVDSLSFGSYSWNNPGNAVIGFDWTQVILPPRYFDSVKKALNITNPYNIPCEQTLDLVFVLGGKELRITPKTYVQYDWNNVCKLRMYSDNSGIITVPIVAFTERCLLYDYEKLEIGFTERLKK